MSWVTVIWSMVASACLTLALMHLLIRWWQAEARVNLVFALSAIFTALLAGCELWMMRAQTPQEFGLAVRWLQVPVLGIVISLVVFVRLYLQAGRNWLAWTVCGTRAFALLLNFLFTPNLQFREITALRHVSFFGEPVAIAVGTHNPWMLVAQVALLLFFIYVADAAWTAWRRRDRRQAVMVGVSIMVFAFSGWLDGFLVAWGIIPLPLTVSPIYMGFILCMGYELSRDVLRAAETSRALQASELERERNRQELAHVARVSTMGQLASTLAHEINQPLGAILRNAEAAELFLQQEPPDHEEVRAILADIRKDDQRAGEVIERMRTLLKKRDVHFEVLLLNELIDHVTTLTHAELAARKVALRVDSSADLRVRGDRVQLQQVLLNLFINGAEAMSGLPREERELTVSMRRDEREYAEISVSDRGHGIPEDKLARIFESFYTTKASGMGMGLAISDTIVKAHGGRMWAENNDTGGATVRFTLNGGPV
ncbi:MAG: ATP-binding protein [Verrucomicrobiota bacterium]